MMHGISLKHSKLLMGIIFNLLKMIDLRIMFIKLIMTASLSETKNLNTNIVDLELKLGGDRLIRCTRKFEDRCKLIL